jgi:hypothetical protein
VVPHDGSFSFAMCLRIIDFSGCSKYNLAILYRPIKTAEMSDCSKLAK